MKKLISVLLACGMLVSMAGCGEPKTTSNGDKVKVTLWTNVTQDSPEASKVAQAELERRLAETFPQYEVEFIPKVYTDYNQEYDKALMVGEAPDAFDMFSYTAIETRIKNGTIADITALVEDWDMKKEDKVINTFDDVIQKDGKWYAIPRHAYTQALYVNKKAIEEGGEDPSNLPQTWDEFDTYCQTITDRDAPRFGYEIMGMSWCAWAFTPWVWAAGGEMVEPAADGKWRIAFADEPGVDAAEYMNKLVTKSKVTQTNILCSIEDTDKDMMSGKACFAWGTLANAEKDKVESYGYSMDDFTMTCIPGKDESYSPVALAGGEVVTFNPTIDEETLKAAFDVMTYIHYDEDYIKYTWQSGFDNGQNSIHVPARKDLFEEKLAMNPFLTDDSRANILAQAAVSKPEPYCEHWSDVKNELVVPLQKIYSKADLTRDDIKKLLSDCADQLVKLYPDTFVR